MHDIIKIGNNIILEKRKKKGKQSYIIVRKFITCVY